MVDSLNQWFNTNDLNQANWVLITQFLLDTGDYIVFTKVEDSLHF